MPAYKDEQRNSWYVRFNYRNYKDEIKPKMKRGFRTKKEALAWEQEFKSKDHIDDTTPFIDICERYYVEHIGIHRASTQQMYRTHINNNLKPFFGDMPFSKIDKKVYVKWRNWLTDTNNKKASYVEKCEVIFRSIYSYGLAELGIERNFLINVKKLRSSEPKREMQFWTYDEFRKFVSFVEDDTLKLVFEILYNSGIRLGEFQALTGADFDRSTQTMKINKSYRRFHGEDIISAPKTAKGNRNISMPIFIFDMLDEYTSRIYGYSPKDRLFPFSKHPIVDAIEKCSVKANIKRIRIHDLRHSHASFLIDQNYPVILISERLGHEKVSVTLDIYGHLFPSRDMEISKILEQKYLESTTM